MLRYAIKSQYNMRDLGGYVTKDGEVTAFGRVIRSDCPYEIDSRDTEPLVELNIGCVIDLRTSEEVTRRPNCFSKSNGTECHNVTFENGNGSPESEESISFTYLKMMEEADTIRRILRIIAESDSTVFYHCAVGKDRTGIVSAIVLSICGVPREDVIADYQVSETYIHELIAEYKKNNASAPEWLGRSKPEYMRDCLRMLEEKYGSFDRYLNKLNISDALIAAIKKKILV